MSRQIMQLAGEKIPCGRKIVFTPFLSSYSNGIPALQVKKWTDEGDYVGEDIVSINPVLRGIPYEDANAIPSGNNADTDDTGPSGVTVYISAGKRQYLDALVDAGLAVNASKQGGETGGDPAVSWYRAIITAPDGYDAPVPAAVVSATNGEQDGSNGGVETIAEAFQSEEEDAVAE